MADDTKIGIRILDAFGNAVDNVIETNPDAARFWLTTAFQVETWRVRYLPERAKIPSGKMGCRLAIEGITGALEHPDEAILTSIFMPNEMFLAMGLRPVIAEAISDFITGARSEEGFAVAAEQRSVPETYCSYHKILVGAAATGVLVAPRLIANCSVACDANNITFKYLSKTLGSPHVYIDVPYEPCEEAVEYVAEQLEDLAKVTEDTFGRTLDRELLSQYVARGQRTLQAMEDTLPLRRGKYLANSMGLEMQEALALHLLLGTEETEQMAIQAKKDLVDASPFHGIELLWVHSAPYFSVPLQKALDVNQKAQIITSDMTFDQLSPNGFVHGPDEPFLAMAERLVYNSFNGPASRRIDRIRTLADASNADGIVVFCHWGCKETMGASQLIRHDLEEAGYPTLVLDGDGCYRRNMSDGQTATRMGAFLEMLRARKEDAS